MPSPLKHEKEVHWGICGAGLISGDFCQALKITPGAKVAAVAARSLAKAHDFAAKHDVLRAYGSYEALAADPAIEIVYIGDCTLTRRSRLVVIAQSCCRAHTLLTSRCTSVPTCLLLLARQA